MVTAPIYKDTEYSTTATSLSYYIKHNNEVIFEGRAYRKPDADRLIININKICQNYLNNHFPSGSALTSFVNTEAVGDFRLYNSGSTLLETYRFSYDWSYDNGTPSTINGHYAYGQYILSTTKSSSSYTTTVTINTNSDYCGDYAIYYLDSYGCWQSYLFEGKCRRYDNYTQYEYNRSFNNNTLDFEKGRYISEINTNYELSTGWLDDGQAYNFSKNLVGTNEAYLHDLTSGRVFPIIIDEQTVEYKQYKTDRHLVEYTIRVVESQNKIRK